MPKLTIETGDDNEILRSISDIIKPSELKQYRGIAENMIKYIKDPDNGGVGLAARPTQGFSVNADDFTLSEIRHRSNPGQKPRLKLFWIEPHQHPSKGIVGRDSVG